MFKKIISLLNKKEQPSNIIDGIDMITVKSVNLKYSFYRDYTIKDNLFKSYDSNDIEFCSRVSNKSNVRDHMIYTLTHMPNAEDIFITIQCFGYSLEVQTTLYRYFVSIIAIYAKENNFKISFSNDTLIRLTKIKEE